MAQEEHLQRNYGWRQELAADSKMPCRAGVARRRGDFVRKNRIRNDVARRASRERATEKRRRVNPEGSKEIKDPGILGTRRQLADYAGRLTKR
jgi:hypothetical protein